MLSPFIRSLSYLSHLTQYSSLSLLQKLKKKFLYKKEKNGGESNDSNGGYGGCCADGDQSKRENPGSLHRRSLGQRTRHLLRWSWRFRHYGYTLSHLYNFHFRPKVFKLSISSSFLTSTLHTSFLTYFIHRIRKLLYYLICGSSFYNFHQDLFTCIEILCVLKTIFLHVNLKTSSISLYFLL